MSLIRSRRISLKIKIGFDGLLSSDMFGNRLRKKNQTLYSFYLYTSFLALNLKREWI